ncbi:MAG: hypothetical protein ANABAC_3316 [Anaerolineae bacterium]|nr:MAG: hypothetical protein ANABAC_3316 [Anaerolineae bacterium]
MTHTRQAWRYKLRLEGRGTMRQAEACVTKPLPMTDTRQAWRYEIPVF